MLLKPTVGAISSMVIDLSPELPVLLAASVRLRGREPDSCRSCRLRWPARSGYHPGVTLTDPSPVVQEPPTEFTLWFVVYGK